MQPSSSREEAAANLTDPIDIRRPNFDKKYANLMYQSETGEIASIEIRPETIEEDVLRQYASKFPKECSAFLAEVKAENQALHHLSGMSEGRRMMAIGRIPEILECALKFVHGEHFGDDKHDWINFFRRNPKFMVGEHHHKAATGIIIR